MYCLRRVLLILFACATPAFAAVTVSSPASGAKVTSPVHYSASATSTCSKGVSSMAIYVDNKLAYSVEANQLNTEITLSTGSQDTVVKAWDKCGSVFHATVNLTVVKPAEPKVSITADPSSIDSVSSSTLTVTAKNATSVKVKGSDDSSYTLADSGGALLVSPNATTEYTVTATGAGGKTSSTTTVTVVPAPTVTITASPTSVASGGPSTVEVTAKNSTKVTLKGSDGSSYTLEDSGGDKTVNPSETTTYTVTATGKGGKTSAAATVSVIPAPTVKITANPTSVGAGSPSILTVNASNATKVTIAGSNSTSYSLPDAGGIQSVSPTTTTTYTVTATGVGGKSSAAATVTVVPAPTVSIIANPTSVLAGSSSLLTVIAANATSVTLSGTDGTSLTLGAAGGSQSVSPTATATYTATATGAGGKATATTTVTVIPAPTVSIAANPTSIPAGSSSILTVTAANATGVTLTGTDGTSLAFGAAGGSASVSPEATAVYTAIATGAGGKATTTATVTVTANTLPTVNITANPTSVAPGSSSTLTVAATNATQVVVTGTDSSSYTLAPAGGTLSVSPTVPTTYTAIATGPVGKVFATVSLTVQGQSGTLSNLQTSFPAWDSFGQLPPKYADCSPCSGIAWSMETGITSPSLSGNAAEFDTSGTVPYAVVLFVNPVIGAYSTQGLPDTDQTLIPSLYNFTYDADFYVTNVAITQALEFDVAMYLDSVGIFWGTQCAPLGDGDWDVLNDTQNWVSTGVPCGMINGWNHVTLQFQRESDNTLLFSSITLNGVTSDINRTATPYTVPSSWYGITVNYQMDGNKVQASNTTYVDNLTLNYW
jgi:hypothetical protein